MQRHRRERDTCCGEHPAKDCRHQHRKQNRCVHLRDVKARGDKERHYKENLRDGAVLFVVLEIVGRDEVEQLGRVRLNDAQHPQRDEGLEEADADANA